jgi:Flp pilus assembly protein CpaB
LKRSNRLVLLIGVFLAVVAFVLILFSLSGNGKKVGDNGGTPTTVTVVVAARDIPLSTKITATDVKTKEVPLDSKPPSYFGDPSQVIGETARRAVLAEQLITDDIVNPGSTLTRIDVPAGYVGVSLLVSQTTGVGTLIKSGDYVDVVMGITGDAVPLVEFVTPAPTAAPKANQTPAAATPGAFNDQAVHYNPTTVKVLAEGLQVLGTLLPPPPATTGNTSTGATGGGTSLNTDQQEMVIVAATIQQAEVIKFAQMQGDISLVLRATADCQTADGQATPCPILPTTGITLRVLVDDYGVLPPQIVEVIEPTPLPKVLPSGHPALVPSPSPSPSAPAVP